MVKEIIKELPAAGRKFTAFLITLAVLIGGLSICIVVGLGKDLYSIFASTTLFVFIAYCGGNVWAKYPEKDLTNNLTINKKKNKKESIGE